MDVCFATLAIQKYRCLAVVLGGLAAKYAGQPREVSLFLLVGEKNIVLNAMIAA